MSKTKRSHRGNMLILVSLSLGLVGLAIIVGMSFAGAIFVHTLMQNEVNELSLRAACTLNAGDRLGQMNNMIARCRSLVKESRRIDEDAQQKNSNIKTLASVLLEESRDCAQELELQRKTLKKIAHAEALNEIQEGMASIQDHPCLILPWIQCEKPQLSTVQFGQVKDVQSNVTALDASNELQENDTTNDFIRAASKRYKANINAKIPAPDADLNFHLSSLQAPVNNDVSPGRIILPDAFTKTPGTDLTSAVKVTIRMKVATEIGSKTKNTVEVTGFSAAPGGCPVR